MTLSFLNLMVILEVYLCIVAYFFFYLRSDKILTEICELKSAEKLRKFLKTIDQNYSIIVTAYMYDKIK